MGSDSDASVMKGATDVLKKFKVPYEAKIVSAHRTPEMMQSYAKAAAGRGLKVLIAGAGGAAHLPGMVASLTTLPVIGVPVTKGKLKGLDALLSVAQMPNGIPVACVATDGAGNAGLLAVRILATENPRLAKALAWHQKEQKRQVLRRQSKLKRILK